MIEYKFHRYKDATLAGCGGCGTEDIPLCEFESHDHSAPIGAGGVKKELFCELCANSLCKNDALAQTIALQLNIIRRELGAFKDSKTVPCEYD